MASRGLRTDRGATLTKDYPFFVDNETEAYGLVKAFFDDYGGMYARFVEWFKTRFVPELERRNGWYWPPLRQAKLDEFRAECAEKIGRSNRTNEVVDLLLAEGGDEFVLKPRLRELTRAGRIRSLSGQLKGGRARVRFDQLLQQLERVPAASAVPPRLPRRRARRGAPEGDLVVEPDGWTRPAHPPLLDIRSGRS